MIANNKIVRISVSILAIALPIIFLINGAYGSFIFTFSIPLLWQVGFLGKSIGSLRIRRKYFIRSILTGILSGGLIGFFGGIALKQLDITGYVYSNVHKLQFSIGLLNISFPLQKEVGYRLLSMSNSPSGVFTYLLFCIFVIGLGEEIFWRGFIQSKLSNYVSSIKSIWITAVLFSLIHFYIFTILPLKAGIIFLSLIAIAGVIWGYLFKYFNNIWSSVISHGLTAFIIWKYYFFKP